jgi:hypothetical protein
MSKCFIRPRVADFKELEWVLYGISSIFFSTYIMSGRLPAIYNVRSEDFSP